MHYLYGASGHAKVVIESIENTTQANITLIDNDESKISLLDYHVIHQMPELVENRDFITLTIGNNKIRKKISTQFDSNLYINVIDNTANISSRAQIGKGSVIMKGVAINSEAIIGQHCIINTNASIDHDCKIGNFVHISPNASLAGNVSIGEGTHIGIGSSVIQGITIGKWTTIGAGAVIIKDIPDHAVVVGNPGKIIKYNKEN